MLAFYHPSPDSTPPPTTTTTSPTNLLDITRAMSILEINIEHRSTDIFNGGASDRESPQPTNGTPGSRTIVSGFDLTEVLSNYGSAKSLPMERWIGEDEKQGGALSLVLRAILPGAMFGFCGPPAETSQGPRRVTRASRRRRSAHPESKKKVKRRNRATRASSVRAEVGSLSTGGRPAREFGEERFESGCEWFGMTLRSGRVIC